MLMASPDLKNCYLAKEQPKICFIVRKKSVRFFKKISREVFLITTEAAESR